MIWNEFNIDKGGRQMLPPERKWVLVHLQENCNIGMGTPPAVVVGYMKFSAGDKNSPFFIIPGCNGSVHSWCDCLPDDFSAPLWNGATLGR